MSNETFYRGISQAKHEFEQSVSNEACYWDVLVIYWVLFGWDAMGLYVGMRSLKNHFEIPWPRRNLGPFGQQKPRNGKLPYWEFESTKNWDFTSAFSGGSCEPADSLLVQSHGRISSSTGQDNLSTRLLQLQLQVTFHLLLIER